MKKIKKNQVIITALAIMIAVAGYINYTGNLSDIISVKDTKDASSDGVVIDENTGEIVNNDAEPDDNSLMEPGSVMLTSGSSVSDSIISEAKLNREQLRAKNKEMLMEIVNNESLDEAAKQAAPQTECIHYETKADFLAAAPQILKEQDAILLKASNAQKFKELVSALQEM